MKGHACKDILLQKKFLLIAEIAPIRSKRKEKDLDILGEYLVTVKCQYTMAIKRPQRNLRVYQYFQQGQAPVRKIYPSGLNQCQTFFHRHKADLGLNGYVLT